MKNLTCCCVPNAGGQIAEKVHQEQAGKLKKTTNPRVLWDGYLLFLGSQRPEFYFISIQYVPEFYLQYNIPQSLAYNIYLNFTLLTTLKDI